MGSDKQSVGIAGALFEDHLQPERLEPPCAALSPHTYPFDRERVAGQPDRLDSPGAVIVETEGDVDELDMKPEISDHRPGADRDEPYTDSQPDDVEGQHSDSNAARWLAVVRRHHAI